MERDSYAIVSERFEKKRENAEHAANERRRYLHKRFPEIRKIDAELAETGLRVMEAALSGGDVDSAIEELKNRNLSLQKKRCEILAANGFPPDYSDIKRECTKCNDSGHVGLKMCDCFKRELNRERYLSAGLGKALENKTFDTFNINYATGKPKGGITPRENLEQVVAFCKKYALEVCKNTMHLLLIGGTGLGKTHLSSAIAIKAIEEGCDVYYDSIINILSKYQRHDEKHIERVMECQLLICDDFGSEYFNDYNVSIIYNILNTRLTNGRSMLINTNLSGEELRKRYDSRICSRIFGEFHIKYLFGQDVRRLLLEKDK